MIGKIKEGKSFGGCVAYNIDREQAEILYAEGVRIQDSQTMTQDFNMQRKMNPNLTKAVGHIILSWSVHDKEKLDDKRMLNDAKEYLNKMNIRNTQLLIVKHTDRNHPHLHVIYNRVNNDGKTISNNSLWKRNITVTQAITKANGYYMAKGKDEINRGRLKGNDKVRIEIYDAVKSILKTADSWESLRNQLRFRGIDLQYKYARGSMNVQGISFSKDGLVFKGSQVDRSLSYGRIDKVISENSKGVAQGTHDFEAKIELDSPISNEGRAVEKEKIHEPDYSSVGMDLIEGLLGGFGGTSTDEDDERNKRKRKNIKR